MLLRSLQPDQVETTLQLNSFITSSHIVFLNPPGSASIQPALWHVHLHVLAARPTGHFKTDLSRPNRRTDLSSSEDLDCTDLSLDGLVCSLSAAVCVAVSDWTFFAHDFGGDVRASFVFNVDDARSLVNLQYHFLMTCGQHVVRECLFCVTMTRAIAKYNVGRECSRQSFITSWNGNRRSILTHEHMVCGELRHAART